MDLPATPEVVRLLVIGGLYRSATAGAPSAATEAEWLDLLAGLTPYRAAVVALACLHGMGVTETAAFLGMPGGRGAAAVSMAKQGALRSLKAGGKARAFAALFHTHGSVSGPRTQE